MGVNKIVAILATIIYIIGIVSICIECPNDGVTRCIYIACATLAYIPALIRLRKK